MDVVIYARYSSSNQKETSIEAQMKECYEYAKQNKYNVVGEYIDKAMSGTSDNRVDFQRMINDSNKKQFEAILVYQLDRFSRNRYDSATYKSKLKKNGVKVLSVREHISDDASGILIESVLEGMAEYYSAELAQKVTRNMRLNAEKCLSNGGAVPLGIKIENKKYVIDHNTAHIVKEVFKMYANGQTIAEIVNYLNSKNYKTASGREFNKNSLNRLLQNKKYIGIYKYGDIEIKDGIPRIIEDSLFYKVQEILGKNKLARARTKAKEEYILTTKLFCGKCKSAMIGICGTSGTNNVVYHYYICKESRKKKCNKKMISKTYIEDIVINECKKLLTNENIDLIANRVVQLCEQQNDNNSNLKWLNKQLKDNERAINNLIDAIEKGENVDIISERISIKREEKMNLEKQIVIENMKYSEINVRQIKFFLNRLKNGDINNINYRKMLVNVFVNVIYLYEREVIITFNIGNTTTNIDIDLLKEIKKETTLVPSLYSNKLDAPKILI